MISGGSELQIGIARRDITPAPGLDLSGFSPRTGASLGTRDPLELHVLVASSADQTVMLATYDLIGLTPEWIGTTRTRVHQATDIASSHQMYCCTHTHLGPETGVIPTMGQPDDRFLDTLMTQTTAAAEEATQSKQPVHLVSGTSASFVAINRRSRMFSPQAPDDGQPDEIDSTVVAVQACTAAGSPLVTLVNYGCHPTSSRERIYSADYPGHVRRRVQQITGATCMYVNGAGGNANLRFDSPSQRGLECARQYGGELGLTAIQALQSPRLGLSNLVGVAMRTATLTLMELPTPPEARSLLALGETHLGTSSTDAERRHFEAYEIEHAKRVLAAHDDPTWTGIQDVEIQALRIGDAAVVATPVELFAEDGLALRSGAPAPALLVAGWSNGNHGYLPTRRAVLHGGYEVESAHRWYQQPAAWDPASGDTIRAAAREAVSELFSRPSVSPFGGGGVRALQPDPPES